MITATFKRNDETRENSLVIKGHAGQAVKGQDIVCASASILAYTVAQIVKAMEHHGDLECEPVVELNDGDATIICRCKNNLLYTEASHAYFVAQVGYSLLEHNYPQFVELNTVGEPEKA